MIQIVADHLDSLKELCRRYRVQSLDVFGSAASGDFDPRRSDLDFLVEFKELPEDGYADAYFGLLEGLRTLFQRDVDLVVRSTITNPYLAESIERSRTPLYAA